MKNIEKIYFSGYNCDSDKIITVIQKYLPKLNEINIVEINRGLLSDYKNSFSLFKCLLDNPSNLSYLENLTAFHYGENNEIIKQIMVDVRNLSKNRPWLSINFVRAQKRYYNNNEISEMFKKNSEMHYIGNFADNKD